MRRKFLTLAVIVSALSLGACADTNEIDQMLQEDMQLNHTNDPGDKCDNPLDPDCTG